MDERQWTNDSKTADVEKRKISGLNGVSYYYYVADFDSPNAVERFGPEFAPFVGDDIDSNEKKALSNDLAKRMNFALHRFSNATDEDSKRSFAADFYTLRNAAILLVLPVLGHWKKKFDNKTAEFLDIEGLFRVRLVEMVPQYNPWKGPPLYTFLAAYLSSGIYTVLEKGRVNDYHISLDDDAAKGFAATVVEKYGPDLEKLALLCLPERGLLTMGERFSIESALGLNGVMKMTVVDASKEIGVSPRRFYALQRDAVEKVKRALQEDASEAGRAKSLD